MTFCLYTYASGEQVVVTDHYVKSLPDGSSKRCHPVAVIDPSDDAQVSRLVDLLVDNGWIPPTSNGLRAALEAFAAPKCQWGVTSPDSDATLDCRLNEGHDGPHKPTDPSATVVQWSVRVLSAGVES